MRMLVVVPTVIGSYLPLGSLRTFGATCKSTAPLQIDRRRNLAVENANVRRVADSPDRSGEVDRIAGVHRANVVFRNRRRKAIFGH